MGIEHNERPRIIATTDGEIDDRCSMNRFLLYANEWEIEGLIYCSSRFHWNGYTWSGEEWIEDQIDLYADVYDSLSEHDPAYPHPEELRDAVYVGNISEAGEMTEETPGSERIVDVLLDDAPGPVYLQAWGGTNTIARALKTIEERHPDRKDEVADKAVIYIILNQDRTLREYIQPNWPELEVINSFKQFRVFAYRWDTLIPDPAVRRYFEFDWMDENIVSGHGPLCSAYPTANLDDQYVSDLVADHVERHSANGECFISEGDTPSYLHQIRVGLGSLEDPSYGGWGGRFGKEPGSLNVWIGTEDDGDLYKPIWRWIPDMQRDWAARADWCVKRYDEANHPPEVVVNGEEGLDSIRMAVEPGETVTVDASQSSDPDGDNLGFYWWNYRDAERFSGNPPAITIERPHQARTAVKIPREHPREYHLILEVTDDGDPQLTRYRRVILDSSK